MLGHSWCTDSDWRRAGSCVTKKQKLSRNSYHSTDRGWLESDRILLINTKELHNFVGSYAIVLAGLVKIFVLFTSWT